MRLVVVKSSVLGLLFALAAQTAFAQAGSDSPYRMSPQQNKAWLVKVKTADKQSQLTFIKTRLIENRTMRNPADSLEVPLLIIDGTPLPDSLSAAQREFLNTELTEKSTRIEIVSEPPSGLYVNKSFPGAVTIVISDKEKSKTFKRLPAAVQPHRSKQTTINTQQQTMNTTWLINGKKVTQRTFKKLLAKLKEVEGTWTCMETRGGGITRYHAKDKNGVVYQYEGRQEKDENGLSEDEQSLTLLSNIP